MAAVASSAHLHPVRRSRQSLSRPSPTERTIETFIQKAGAMLSEFAHRADLVVSEMETGELFSLADFERHWDEVQIWLKARLKQVRALEAAAERVVAKNRWRTGDGGAELSHEALVELVLNLDRLCQRIDRMLLNTSAETYDKLAGLKESCLVLRNGILN